MTVDLVQYGFGGIALTVVFYLAKMVVLKVGEMNDSLNGHLTRSDNLQREQLEWMREHAADDAAVQREFVQIAAENSAVLKANSEKLDDVLNWRRKA